MNETKLASEKKYSENGCEMAAEAAKIMTAYQLAEES